MSADIEIKVTADVQLSPIDALKAKLNQTRENIELLKQELKGMGQSLSANDKSIAAVNKQLKSLNTGTRDGAKEAAGLKAQLSTLASVNDTLVKGIASTKMELQNETAALRTHTKEVVAAEKGGKGFSGGLSKIWSGLRNIAYIVPGLGIAGLIGLLTGPLVEGLSALVAGFTNSRNSIKQFNEALEGGKDGFVKATTEVSNLRVAFDQAKQGIISKEEALKLYNSTIGKTTGEVKNLDDAEMALNKNAEAYIKFSLLKASANFALEESAKKAFEAEKNRIKQASEFKTIGTSLTGFAAGQSSAPGFVPGLADLNKQFRAQEKAAEENKQKQIKIAQDESNSLLGISKKFFSDAEKIAKEFKFDFNAIAEPSVKAAKAVKEKIEKEFQAEKLFLRPQLIDISSATVLLNKEKAEKELNDQLGKFKMVPIKIDIDGGDIIRRAREVAKEVEAINIQATQNIKMALNSAFASVGESIATSLGEGADFGKTVFGSLFKVLGAGLKQLGEAMIAIGTAKIALEKFEFAPGIGTVIAGIAAVALGSLLQKAIPGFASGVTNFGGGLAIVGEKGPELVRLPRGSDVIPNNKLNDIGGGGQQVFIPAITLRGSDLVIAFNRASQTISRNG